MPALARPAAVAPLLLGSGFCALVYQIAWQREFRLIFGSSTAASAAVLAIFIGGTGVGGLLLGKRSDAHPRPLRLYANLELAIAGFAVLTPLLLDAARSIYRTLGGTLVLGATLGTILRLLLAALVLGPPTLLMGGTLPAAVRSVERTTDSSRRLVGLLYAANTLGAVLGCVIPTLWTLEMLGTRRTLLAASVLNAGIALIAHGIAQSLKKAPAEAGAAEEEPAAEPAGPTIPPRAVLAFAGVSGFVFFWMELVWYRMLAPLLGGTVYTFGLILAVALLGIGLGGLLYVALGHRLATPAGLARTCALEALFIGLPFALGDRLALLTLALRPAQGSGLLEFVPGWLAVASIVVLPAAIVAGAQYPLMIALLGAGPRRVGSHIGTAAACNTIGAMVGALAGGFVLLPRLTAPGSWRAVVIALLAMSLGASYFAFAAGPAAPSRRLRRRAGAPAMTVVLTALALVCIAATGPTAAWRHSPIGAGRVDRLYLDTPAFARYLLQITRYGIVWEAEGVETSVALDGSDGLAFVSGGKVDGNARGDASTQVMGGLLGALLHPNPRSAMVIGFGTGSSAGWLGAVPSIERVDVAELEPSMRTVGERCAPVNHDALANPKLRLLFGDAREILLTIPSRYDVIFSEPSNPYRAGIASLFTREYYEAVRSRLEPGGLFVQWVQAYEVDVGTVKTIYATLASVFPSVETWYLGWNDLVLIGTLSPPSHNAAALRARVTQEPYREALASAWRTEGLEGLLAHYVATPSFAAAIAGTPGQPVNTDDRNHVEFSFARQLGSAQSVPTLFEPLRERNEDRPPLLHDDVDYVRVMDERIMQIAGDGTEPHLPDGLSPAQLARAQAAVNYVAGNIDGALAKWRTQEQEPISIVEVAMVAEGLANAGDEAALPLIDKLSTAEPVEAKAILARYRLRKGLRAEAASLLVEAFVAYRRNPWPSQALMGRALTLAQDIAADGGGPEARALFEALDTPFSVLAQEGARKLALEMISRSLPEENLCLRAWKAMEPHVPWDRDLLDARQKCYGRWNHPLATAATKDLERYDACTGLHGWVFCL